MVDEELIEKFSEINERLEVIIHLLQSQIMLNESPIKEGTRKRDVLDLCNFSYTREDIKKILKMNISQVDNILSDLRKMDIIRSIKIGENIFYIRTRW